MVASHLIKDHPLPFDKKTYHEQIFRLSHLTTLQIKKIIFSYVFFNALFLALALIEFFLLIILFTLFTPSSLTAFLLAIGFLTFFSYFTLRLYFQAKKPDQFADIIETFLGRCKELIRYQENIPEHPIALANASTRFAKELEDKEYTLYTPPAFLHSFGPLFEKLGAYFHWKDFHRLRELLLQASVDEHLKVVKCEPVNLEVHAALANAYVMLSSLYANPTKLEHYDHERWHPKEKTNMEEQFRAVAERAIEEFKILNTYAPDDPWIHKQLAYSYHDLMMPAEEILEYETILKLMPNDKDTLFTLGMLYFQQGRNAEGLQIYERLKKIHPQKAESLIKFYGSYETHLVQR